MTTLTVERVDLRVTTVSTRIPFRYGIAEMREAPHVVVAVSVRRDGEVRTGMASDNLPPKWFTKNVDSHIDDDIAEMKTVISSAADLSRGLSAPTPFALWWELHSRQTEWGSAAGYPPLLFGFGTSLVERAVIDAFCRLTDTTFGDAVRENSLGIDLGSVHPELRGREPADFLPSASLRSLAIRHTIGLGEHLSVPEVALDDGRPDSPAEAIRVFGLDHLKVKTRGDVAADLARMRAIARLTGSFGRPFRLTVDGNESFRAPEPFIDWWQGITGDTEVAHFLERSLIALEQPFHRDVALAPAVAVALAEHPDLPPIIIDESDGAIDSVRVALDLGYAGGTYKGCKGVMRGVMNACLVASRSTPDHPMILTAEDLATLPPLTLLQDFAVAAALGIDHIERNGHYFFGGVAALDPDVDSALLRAHSDIFAADEAGRARLRIDDGKVSVGSAVDAPFGCAAELDVSSLPVLAVHHAER